jgi:hypothetical protein
VALIGLLWKMGLALMETNPWLFVAAPLLVAGCLAVSRVLLASNKPRVQTLAISNVNRHVGLALLLSGQYLRHQSALPAVASYELAAPLVMWPCAKFARRGKLVAAGEASNAKPAVNR